MLASCHTSGVFQCRDQKRWEHLCAISSHNKTWQPAESEPASRSESVLDVDRAIKFRSQVLCVLRPCVRVHVRRTHAYTQIHAHAMADARTRHCVHARTHSGLRVSACVCMDHMPADISIGTNHSTPQTLTICVSHLSTLPGILT